MSGHSCSPTGGKIYAGNLPKVHRNATYIIMDRNNFPAKYGHVFGCEEKDTSGQVPKARRPQNDELVLELYVVDEKPQQKSECGHVRRRARSPPENNSRINQDGDVTTEFIENFSKIAKPLTLLTQKNKTYVWGDKQDEAFCILKEKLCNAPVLALPDGPNDFVVYSDVSKQGFRRLIELLSDYECEIKYHPGKANVVADALSRKERLKPRRVCAMSITIHFVLKTKILEAHGEASKDLKAPAEWLRGLETHFKQPTV
ncbi:putative reverse transcriptase domain-containing protein [Tanacetum coccineum]